MLRVATATGERLAVVSGRVPEHAESWQSRVAQRTQHGLRSVLGPSHVSEHVAGARFRITGGAFFQNNTAGGGLFTVTVGKEAGEVHAIEVSPTALSDLRHNLEANEVKSEVVPGEFEACLAAVPGLIDLLVVDPPRTGLRSAGVEAVLDAFPRVIAYVSCDPASFARDAGELVGQGYRLDWVTPVDLFPQTWHVEAVARFER